MKDMSDTTSMTGTNATRNMKNMSRQETKDHRPRGSEKIISEVEAGGKGEAGAMTGRIRGRGEFSLQ